MRRTFSLAGFCLTGLIGSFGITTTLKAAQPEAPPAKSAAVDPVSKGTPKIQFETNFFDFGKTTAVETLSGVFKFKNVGDGILKVDRLEPSCDCTEPRVKPDTLAPGDGGEITYLITVDRALNGQRYIRVHSNDPKSPVVQLTIQADCTPLYELSSKTLWMMLPAGKDEAQGKFTVTRTDGRPLEIDRLTASQEWISAAFDPSFKPQESSARINVTVHRPSSPPSLINATVQMWNSNQPARPLQSILLTGEIQGELAAVPPRLYWVIPDFGKDKAGYPVEALTRNVELRSVLGHKVELKNAASNIKGLSVQIVPKEPGKTFDLVLQFNELPQAFTNGNVTVETSLASLPKLEVPVTIAVPSAN